MRLPRDEDFHPVAGGPARGRPIHNERPASGSTGGEDELVRHTGGGGICRAVETEGVPERAIIGQRDLGELAPQADQAGAEGGELGIADGEGITIGHAGIIDAGPRGGNSGVNGLGAGSGEIQIRAGCIRDVIGGVTLEEIPQLVEQDEPIIQSSRIADGANSEPGFLPQRPPTATQPGLFKLDETGDEGLAV